jgi:hypothetical protein
MSLPPPYSRSPRNGRTCHPRGPRGGIRRKPAPRIGVQQQAETTKPPRDTSWPLAQHRAFVNPPVPRTSPNYLVWRWRMLLLLPNGAPLPVSGGANQNGRLPKTNRVLEHFARGNRQNLGVLAPCTIIHHALLYHTQEKEQGCHAQSCRWLERVSLVMFI